MIQIAKFSPHESSLVRVFRDRKHESDIVGLAKIPTDEATLQLSLRTLDAIVTNRVVPDWNADESLAKVLVAMTSVARNYTEGAQSSYWGDVTEAIKGATGHWTELATDATLQAALGISFHNALRRFNYSRPEDVGLVYVGTVLFHTGIPRSATKRVMSVVIEAYRCCGVNAINLGAVSRRCLVKDIPQINVRRLLANDDFLGANELWRSLARVVDAWWRRGDLPSALHQLPEPALDAEQVRTVLEHYDRPPERQGSLFDF